APPGCKWCTNCPEGACIGAGGSCRRENDCRINQREIFAPQNCSEAACGAPDCPRCAAAGRCMWTRQFKRTGETRRILSVQPSYDWTCFSHSLLFWGFLGGFSGDLGAPDCPRCAAAGRCMWTRQFKRTGETRRILSVQPSYDWTCFSHSLLNVSPMPVESAPPLPCPRPCHLQLTCHTCLSSAGADGGWQHCLWSVGLKQCLSPSFAPLLCLTGGCGLLLRGGGGAASGLP
ncbi:multiple epidermal growth factor-like domains protein 8, partial [Cyanistes caeruleus]|uniref:multiple epidermal growth factor-like domains protein 8 n=1 Tax=Cyanistes caeruleus TaxID=156563 RepID=UPI000CDB5803